MSHLSRIPVRERVRSFTALELGQAVFAYLCSEMYIARYIIATGRDDGALSFEGALNLISWLRYMLATMFSLSDRECEEIVSYTAIVTRDDQAPPDYIDNPKAAAAFYAHACDRTRELDYVNAVCWLRDDLLLSGDTISSISFPDRNGTPVPLDYETIEAALRRYEGRPPLTSQNAEASETSPF